MSAPLRLGFAASSSRGGNFLPWARYTFLMLPYRDSRFTTILLLVFFIIAAGYAFFEARGVLFGPEIDVPQGVVETHDSYVLISGSAKRISELSMNGMPISVTENGSFSQPYLLASGYNRIVLDAKDQYGRTREKILEITYTPLPGSGSPQAAPATTTAPSTAATSSLP